MRSGELVFVSGAGPGGPQAWITGKVGADVDLPKAQEAAKLSVLGCLSALQEELGDLDRVRRIVKLLGFVNSAPGFNQQHVVMDGASTFLVSLFGEQGVHACLPAGRPAAPWA